MRPLTDLSPQALENLTYDLIRSTGMQNLVWRTPGSDGGRDLDGEFTEVDFSGARKTQRWYIECKRYAAAVDWPTVWNKISYADAARADFLLMITTSSYSPQCVDQIAKWNDAHRYPIVRVWSRHELIQRLQRHPEILLKYGLSDDTQITAPAMAVFAAHLAKMSIAANTSYEFVGNPGRYLAAASALSELLSVRIEDLEKSGRIVVRVNEVTAPPNNAAQLRDPRIYRQIDIPALNALIALVSLVTACESVDIKPTSERELSIIPRQAKHPFPPSVFDLISVVAFWGDLEVTQQGTLLSVVSRKKMEP